MIAESLTWTATEMMTIAAARLLRNDDVCLVGIGAPSTACNLARHTHAPRVRLIYESGVIDARPEALPLSVGDPELAQTALVTVPLSEMFRFWLQGGRIGIGFLGAAQIDRFGNLNSTVIGDYARPQVRLPGAGGAPEIATHCREVFVILSMTPRQFVERLSFRTTLGHGDGGDDRQRLGVSTRGPTRVITDLCILEPNPVTRELEVVSIHSNTTREQIESQCGWRLRFAVDAGTTPAPTAKELATLRALLEHTRQVQEAKPS